MGSMFRKGDDSGDSECSVDNVALKIGNTGKTGARATSSEGIGRVSLPDRQSDVELIQCVSAKGIVTGKFYF